MLRKLVTLGTLVAALVVVAAAQPKPPAPAKPTPPDASARFANVKEWTAVFTLSRRYSGTGKVTGADKLEIVTEVGTRENAGGTFVLVQQSSDDTSVSWEGSGHPTGSLDSRVSRVQTGPDGSFTQTGSSTGAGASEATDAGFMISRKDGTYELRIPGASVPGKTSSETIVKSKGLTIPPEHAEGAKSVSIAGVTVEHIPLPADLVLKGSRVLKLPYAAATGAFLGTTTSTDAEVTVTWSITPGANKTVKAKISPIAAVDRGAVVNLVGTDSEPKGGKLKSYRWTFSDYACEDGDAPTGTAQKDGARKTVVALCAMTAKLTVSDGAIEDSTTARIQVNKRADWKTQFAMDSKERRSDGDPITVQTVNGTTTFTNPGGYTGGENACAIEASAAGGAHLLHPAITTTGEAAKAYVLAEVSDPGGPFDGYAYVKRSLVQMKRAIYVNPYVVENGRPPMTGMKTFYAVNKQDGMDVVGYLAGIRAHEGFGNAAGKGHSALMKEGLATNNPGEKLEPMVRKTKSALVRDADQAIRDAERAICNMTKDPLALHWDGKLEYPDAETGRYQIIISTSVGGKDSNEVTCP